MTVTRTDRDGVAVLALSSPPVNALGHAVRSPLSDHLVAIATDATIQAIVLHGEGRCFSAGADIREFGAPPKAPMLRDVIDQLEALSIPTIAAIHGQAFGGGLELALGCHFRLATKDAQLGLPEVKLGIIPGAGGTQRLPRLIGVERAGEVIATGRALSGCDARALGIVDSLCPGVLVEDACAFAHDVIRENRSLVPVRERAVIAAEVTAWEALEAKTARQARGLKAPLAALESVANAATLDFDAGMARERDIFESLRDGDESAAQRHLFFATREARKIAGVTKETPARQIDSVAVIGAGTMGAGIAACFADAGFSVRVMETSDEALKAGLDRIDKLYSAQVAKGRLDQTEASERRDRIHGVTEYNDLGSVDMVIEAAFEDLAVKQDIFRKLDFVAKSGAVLATNTSTLDIDAIAGVTSRPSDVVGMHFFSPANVMKLLENVRGAETSPDVLKAVTDVGIRIGKVPVMVGNADGFVGNRMYHRYTRQAYFLVEEGAMPDQVDAVFRNFGFAMGPFAVGDLSGLDISYAVRQRQRETWPEGERYPVIADRVVEAGRLGRKNGKGWYRYGEDASKPEVDSDLKLIIDAASEELGLARRMIEDQEIHERCFYALINEGAKILSEGVAARASDIDVIWINGYGFPMKHGGPMHYADRIGLTVIRDRLAHWADTRSDALKPARLLEELADQGRSFVSFGG